MAKTPFYGLARIDELNAHELSYGPRVHDFPVNKALMILFHAR